VGQKPSRDYKTDGGRPESLLEGAGWSDGALGVWSDGPGSLYIMYVSRGLASLRRACPSRPVIELVGG
jgi:hypothetical protein